MKKAKFIIEQPEVSYKVNDDIYYIQICLNGEYKEDETSEMQYWECDFNEIITDNIDIEDVVENPENYINYVVKHVDPSEQLRADVDYLLLLSEV